MAEKTIQSRLQMWADFRTAGYCQLGHLSVIYAEYKSKSYICEKCPQRERCTTSQNCTKVVTRHVWKDYVERAEDIRHSPLGKETYAMRGQTIERVFGDAKEKHAMRYTPYRGLNRVSNWIKLKYAAMNLKKPARWKWNTLPFTAVFHFVPRFRWRFTSPFKTTRFSLFEKRVV